MNGCMERIGRMIERDQELDRQICDGRIGFDACSALFQAESLSALDDAMRIVNNFYRIYRQHLEVIEEIQQ